MLVVEILASAAEMVLYTLELKPVMWANSFLFAGTLIAKATTRRNFPQQEFIIDCTEVFCEMPNSLLLNSELFSSYRYHVT